MFESYKRILNNQLLPWLVVLCAFSVPLKTGVFSVLIGLLIITWAVSGDYEEKFERVLANRTALAACLLFLVFTIGLFYGEMPWRERIPGYLKYHKLLYIPIVVSIIKNERYRKLAINAFLVGCLVVLLASYLEFFSVIPFHDDGQGFVVTKNRITHNILMSFAAFLMMHRAYLMSGAYRYVWIGLSFLAVFNVLVMVNGLTGQLTLALLFLLFLFQIKSLKPLKVLLAGLLVIVLAVQFFGLHPNNRLISQFSGVKDTGSSSGQRLGFYRNTIDLIKQSPLYGHGSGSFRFEYQKIIDRTGEVKLATTNPHNQYLLIASELGLIGLVAFIYLFLINLQSTPGLEFVQDRFALQGLVLVVAFGSLFNSLLMDAGEGRFYTLMIAIMVAMTRRDKQ